MREIYFRLRSHPWLTLECLLISLLISVLGLAVPLYVIQVLNRYLQHGVGATLITLTLGVLLAIALEWGFRQLRLRLAEGIGAKRNRELMLGTMGILATARVDALARYTPKQREDLIANFELIESAYNANHLTALFDLPFALLFIVVLTLISPVLGAIAAAFAVTVFIYALLSQWAIRRQIVRLAETASKANQNVRQLNLQVDSTRLFDRARQQLQRWEQQLSQWLIERRHLGRTQGSVQGSTAALQAIMSVAIYAWGARLVIAGDLNIGLLIGANILAFRALGPVIRFAQMGEVLIRAQNALEQLEKFASLPLEPNAGTAKRSYTGALELQDLAFSYPGMAQPLFESLNLSLPPGSVLVVTGRNGTGKTTLARLLTGLLQPTRGTIRADGIDLRQLAPQWWRAQLQYLPQEPETFSGTLRELLQTASLQTLTESQLDTIIRRAGLGRFVDHSDAGLDQELAVGSGQLALGYRRRLALARALAVNGRLVVFDDPMEALDDEGRAVMGQLLGELRASGHTLVLLSDSPEIMKQASILLNLNHKPVPLLQASGAERPA